MNLTKEWIKLTLEQVLKFFARNLHSIIKTSLYTTFETWCITGDEELFDKIVKEIEESEKCHN